MPLADPWLYRGQGISGTVKTSGVLTRPAQISSN